MASELLNAQPMESAELHFPLENPTFCVAACIWVDLDSIYLRLDSIRFCLDSICGGTACI